MRRHFLVVLASLVAAPASALTDLSQWTLIEDPADPGMSATIDNPSQATLTATGAIPSGTDIGYASVNGADVAGSTFGYYFDPATDFSVAIDFDQSAVSSIGGSAIGFGVGEDVAGADSAGIVLGIVNGAATVITTGARVNDVDQTAATLVPGFATGRFFIDYDSTSGDVTVGVNATPGAAAPGVSSTLSGIQDLWDDEPLLLSFFLRSQAVNPLPALSSGSVEAVFSNLEVLSGTPIALVPEPGAALLLSLALAGGLSRRR